MVARRAHSDVRRGDRGQRSPVPGGGGRWRGTAGDARPPADARLHVQRGRPLDGLHLDRPHPSGGGVRRVRRRNRRKTNHFVQRPVPGVGGRDPGGHYLVPRPRWNADRGLVDEAPRLGVRRAVSAGALYTRRAAQPIRQRLLPRIPDAGEPGLLRAVHQSARLHRLRPCVHVRLARALGDGGLPGLDARGRRGDPSLRPGGHDADGRARRVVRRVHDQLDRRAHPPIQGGTDRPLHLELVLVVRLVGRAGSHGL